MLLNVAQCCAAFADAQHWMIPCFLLLRHSAFDSSSLYQYNDTTPRKIKAQFVKFRENFPALGNPTLTAKKVPPEPLSGRSRLDFGPKKRRRRGGNAGVPSQEPDGERRDTPNAGR